MPDSPIAVFVDPLEKVLPQAAPSPASSNRVVGVPGEIVLLQVAFAAGGYEEYDRVECDVVVDTDLTLRSVSLVRPVPCELPAYPAADDGYLTRIPGILPDRLERIEPGRASSPRARFMPGHWQSVLVELVIDDEAVAGSSPVEVLFVDDSGATHAAVAAVVEVLDVVRLGRLASFPHSEWLHADALAAAYGVELWSEEHWSAVDAAMRTMGEHAINTLLTPLFTPPLDTAVGAERATTQLVDVHRDAAGYRFGFDRLDRWLAAAERHGMTLIEFAPLFTQWGGAHAPKIVATVDGRDGVRIFGWETDSASTEYRDFLVQALQALLAHLADGPWLERCFFHVSDEPRGEHVAAYRDAASLVAGVIGEIPIRDATIEVDLYRDGVIPLPIAGIEVLADFVAAGATDAWGYTSCAHHVDVPNAFIALSGARCRMLGVQLYLNGATGYLRWGYNFWFSQYSRGYVDPHVSTDARLAFPAGDPFLIYPGPDLRPEESLRLKYLRQAMDDVRLLRELEGRIGRDAVLGLLEQIAGGTLSVSRFPDSPDFFSRLREAILASLASAGDAQPALVSTVEGVRP